MLLKKSANYNRWSEDIQGILTLDYCWFINIRKETMPKISQALPKEKPVYTRNDGKFIEAVIYTELAKDVYEAKIDRYKEKLLDSDDKCS